MYVFNYVYIYIITCKRKQIQARNYIYKYIYIYIFNFKTHNTTQTSTKIMTSPVWPNGQGASPLRRRLRMGIAAEIQEKLSVNEELITDAVQRKSTHGPHIEAR